MTELICRRASGIIVPVNMIAREQALWCMKARYRNCQTQDEITLGNHVAQSVEKKRKRKQPVRVSECYRW